MSDLIQRLIAAHRILNHEIRRELARRLPDSIRLARLKKLQGYGITPNPVPEVQWNFEKFLIGRDGRVAGRFAPDVTADDPRLLQAIDAELAKQA